MCESIEEATSKMLFACGFTSLAIDVKEKNLTPKQALKQAAQWPNLGKFPDIIKEANRLMNIKS